MSHHHHVPDFEMDDEYSIPTSSPNLSRPKKSAMAEEEEIMELLWQNGQVVVQTQNQRSFKKSHIADEAVTPAAQHSAAREIRSEDETTPHLFMQEDEMASWLHYSIPLDDSSFDRDIYSDLFYPAPSAPLPPRDVRPPPPSASVTSTAAPRPPIPQARREDVASSARIQNFMHFTRPKGRMESGPSSSSKAVRESTVVDSNDTPAVGPESRVSHATRSPTQVSGGNRGCGTMSGTDAGNTATAARELATTCDLTMASSSNNSGASVSGSAEQERKPPQEKPEDRKRKGREADDNEYHSEDADFESADAKKPAHGSTSTKRSRAAEVHNLSERKRRDRINEKMRALQELIPRCNKSDKASMLDEAIEYLKSLQLQLQMMSMGCGMVPMMFPGVHQYMPPMGMGMGMGMDMGMNLPMVPFPTVLPGSALPTPAGSAHLGPRFPIPAFHMSPFPVPDASRIQAANQPSLASLASQNANHTQIPNFADPYQQYLAFHQTQVSYPQNQAVVHPGNIRPSCSNDAGNSENHQSG